LGPGATAAPEDVLEHHRRAERSESERAKPRSGEGAAGSTAADVTGMVPGGRMSEAEASPGAPAGGATARPTKGRSVVLPVPASGLARRVPQGGPGAASRAAAAHARLAPGVTA